MEKRRNRRPGLTSLFWRYLITSGAVVLALTILWWMGLTHMIRQGVIYPASTAADGVNELLLRLESGQTAPAEIPYYYRWALFGPEGQLVSAGNMNALHLEYARAAMAGDLAPQGFFYAQYHRIARLPEGGFCVVQYDYSMPYGSAALQRRLPEFQTCAMLFLIFSWLAAGAVITRHFAGLLRRDAALLTDAAKTIARQRLDAPLTGRTRVREFGQTLEAMDRLREGLAQSLKEQWSMEQQRRLELAALTHDLKTPLTVISGNAELLQEDPLTPEQKQMADAILRSSLRLQDYLAQLRAMTGPEAAREHKERLSLEQLAESWKGVGQSLCSAKQVRFQISPLPSLELEVFRASLDRAVNNLLDNAVRYTPAGGTVCLNVCANDGAVILSVEDTGPGFSAEALVKGEQAFFTSDASRPQEGHMGMGLFFASRTALRHGGRLCLSNTIHGAKAALILPFTPV